MTDSQSNDRDASGKFVVGNGAGRGNCGSRERSRLGRVLRAVVDENAILAIASDLLDIARNPELEPGARIAAARILLEHSVGRPRESEPDAVPLALPSLRSPAAIVEAVANVFEALAAGDVNVTDAGRLVDAITKAAAASAWSSLEKRVAGIEQERAQARTRR